MARKVSWMRVLVHGLCAWILTFSVLWGLADVLGQLDVIRDLEPDELGGLVSKPVWAAAVVTFVLSALFQAGHRAAAWSMIVVLLALLGFVTYGIVDGIRHPVRPLTTSERAALEVVVERGQQRLRHPELGFSLAHPGRGFIEDRTLADDARRAIPQFDTAFHGWIDAEKGALVIAVIADTLGSRRDLEEFVDGMERGIIDGAHRQLGPDSTIRHLTRQLVWERDRREAHLHSVIADTTHMRIDVHGLAKRDRVALIFTMTTEDDTLAAVNASFRP